MGTKAYSQSQAYREYLNAVKFPFIKLARLRFLNADGSTAFALYNNPNGKKNKTFLQDGSITVNLQNGQRRQANIILSNENSEYDYNINSLWFGQKVALDEGLLLPDGTEFYLPQGVFYIANPTEELFPGNKTMSLSLVDKWGYLDGTLFGNLDGTWQVPVGTNIFEAMSSVLTLDRGNGVAVDEVNPVFTEYYNGKTQVLPDGQSASLVQSPYTLTIDSIDGTYADILLGLSGMLNAWIGYDRTGRLRVDPSQDDLLDISKPIQYEFSPNEAQFLGATYTVQNTEVFNDVIVMGESLDNNPQAAGRAENMDPMSDTNIYTSLGRRTKRISASGYYTKTQCMDLAAWKMKRMTVLQKSVTVSCGQLFHLEENNLITIHRPDKPGNPSERHLIMGFSRPIGQTGAMTLNCVSVNDFPAATITGWPE